MLKKIPNYIKYIFTNVFFLFLYLFILRLLFYFFFSQINNGTSSEISKAFNLGIRFDIKLATLIILPLAILIFIVRNRFFSSKIFKLINTVYLTITYIVVTLFYVFDFGYYDYLEKRLDATSLRFLDNLDISTQVLFESYPVYKGLILLLILSFLFYKLAQFIYRKYTTSNLQFSKKKNAFFIITSFLLLAFGVYNSITHYPLRWSQAFFSKNNQINQFALNPVLYFFDSFKFRSKTFDIEKTKQFYPTIARELNLPKDTLLFERKFIKNDTITKQPNVVIVMLESLGVVPMSYFGNTLPTTPKMDSIIKKSARFTNFYIPREGTAPSVFASITGLPDVEDKSTASRNPLIINQRIIFDQFKGYEKLYFLGGSANWANIRGVFQSNIKKLKIFEEGSYKTEKRADVWGIDDYELFKESDKILTELHQEKKPFIAYIQTATNHMPFTVPDKKESFRPLKEGEISEEKLAEAGFDGIDRLNALRYLDFNVDVFLKRAQKAGYFENTIFLFFGDHNTAMEKVDKYTKEFDLDIEVHHVPFFIHAPNFVSPKEINSYTKIVDIVPTAASLANINYTNYTLGSNILNDSLKRNNFSFLNKTIKGEPGIVVLKDSLYYEVTLSSNKAELIDLKGNSLDDIKKKYPKKTKELDSLAKGFYHSAKYLFYNNKKTN